MSALISLPTYSCRIHPAAPPTTAAAITCFSVYFATSFVKATANGIASAGIPSTAADSFSGLSLVSIIWGTVATATMLRASMQDRILWILPIRSPPRI